MFFQVRVMLVDRPGALAALASSCGQTNVNILELQIFPTPDGRVVDELVLQTPGGWSRADVERLCRRAGAASVVVAPCAPEVLVDRPVRFLRAARALVGDPDALEDLLCDVLDARPAGGDDGEELVLDGLDGSAVALARAAPFTEVERVRAEELRDLAQQVRDRVLPCRAPDAGTRQGLEVRPGSTSDAAGVLDLHDRCSARTLRHRYHSPRPRVGPEAVSSMLEPDDGFSVVVTCGEEVVAMGLVARTADGWETGLLVEDRWQRRGVGTRLLQALLGQAAGRGIESVVCVARADDESVARTIRRAGFTSRTVAADGVVEHVVEVPGEQPRKRGGRRGQRDIGKITAPLVALLHERSEFRETLPHADFIDHAIRG